MVKKKVKVVKSKVAIKCEATELNHSQLRWVCPTSQFKFESTASLKPLDKIVGQPRAIESIRLGAELFSKGYNIFVTGLAGTGRLTTVKNVLEDVTTVKPTTYDYCYVNNFTNADEPRLLKLSKGRGKELKRMMKDTIEYLKRRLPKLFEEETIQKSRRILIEEYQKKEKELLDKFDKKIKPLGFVRGQLENENGAVQPEVFPIVDGQPVRIDTLDELVAEGKMKKKDAEEIKNNYLKFHNEIFELAHEGLKLMQDFKKAIYENDKSTASMIIHSVFGQIKENFVDDKVDLYIEEVKKYILENIKLFVTAPNPIETENENEPSSDDSPEDRYRVFEVNIILDNSKTTSAPVVVETAPTYTNLFGTIERTFDSRGYWRTDFTKIKAGSILRADQGYLIVNALDLFTEQGVWPVLKRVLLYDKLEIQPYEAIFQLSQLIMKPEAIDVKVKVVIIGGSSLYYYLYTYEKGFKKIFKINAQFDYETERTKEMINYYAQFIAKICKEDKLPHCTPDAVAAIVEWAVEQAGSQNRITLKFSDVADVVREAAFYDGRNRKEPKKFIRREDVKTAIEYRRYRNNLLDEKLKIQILEGNTLIDTDGERVGQINGLTILDTGLIIFGKPARITATVSAGDAGIINIEREVDMSGSIHNKGVMILSGFIRERFSTDKPFTLTASIAFEQNYGGIDGDSATAAEIYALLSAITNVPIKQCFAITGSVNQKGDIQPIGGVNEKIRGFFEICQARGLNGQHGVIIPKQNVGDLMLIDDIVNAVKDGKFHIYSFTKIEDAVKLLMGIEAGVKQEDGKYPDGTLFKMVIDRLEELRLFKRKRSSFKSDLPQKNAVQLKPPTLEEILKLEKINEKAY
ncbi:ATP-binding protein [Bacteroidetes/Chlorobi group bacterium ChocPot_Mid]|nr:MAG: ATP-binding protein [Bacteroidetes/Chlorobi group bacterium ChocPot_Mid]